MLKRLTNNIKKCFAGAEQTIKTFILALIPIMVLFMILSDRTPYNYITIVLYAIEIILILIFIIKYHSFIFDSLTKILVLFLGAILLSQLLNFSLFEFPRSIFLLSIFSIIFYQFLLSITNKEKELIFKLMVIGGLLFVGFFVIFYFKNLIHLNFGERLGRDFSDQNDLAKNIALLTIICEVMIFKTGIKQKIFFIISCLVFVFVILLTGSISNLLVLLSLSIFLMFYINKGKKRLWVLIGIIVVLGCFIAALQLPLMSYFKTRIVNMFNSLFSSSKDVDNSFVDRYFLAVYGFRLFVSKPVFGYGYDRVQYYTWGKNAFSHNNFIELLASFGIIGFVVFEALLIIPIVKMWKKNKKELALFTALYLFLFQIFLIIYRKKIEYFIIPLAFSFMDSSIGKCFSVSLCKKKIVVNKISHFNVCSKECNVYYIDI